MLFLLLFTNKPIDQALWQINTFQKWLHITHHFEQKWDKETTYPWLRIARISHSLNVLLHYLIFCVKIIISTCIWIFQKSAVQSALLNFGYIGKYWKSATKQILVAYISVSRGAGLRVRNDVTRSHLTERGARYKCGCWSVGFLVVSSFSCISE